MAGNRNLLIVIAIVLLGILAVLVVGAHHRTPSEKISDGLHDVGNGVGDAVKNATH